jgi:hypothetical protein
MSIGIRAGFESREVGTLPVSVGTSLAIEALTQPHQPHFDYLWINVRTLYRNLIESVTTQTRDAASPAIVAEVLLDEISHINTAVQNIFQGRITPQLYVSEPQFLVSVLPEAILRSPQTDLQKLNAFLADSALDLIRQQLGKDAIMRFTPVLAGTGRTVLLTHFATDLLGHRNFKELMLLESHTGKIKRYAEFNTKLTDGKTLTNMPFNGFTLCVFGDGNVVMRQMPPKIRKVVLELADKYRWTPITTRDKIRFGIDSIKDEFGKKFLRNVLSKTKY